MYVVQKSNADVIERPFRKMGARVKFGPLRPDPWRIHNPPLTVTLDVGRDQEGEYFLVRKSDESRIEVLEVDPENRHLLLLTLSPGIRNGEIKARFLLGHDERHWFVAAIPERTPVTSVAKAIEALKPLEVITREHDVRVKARGRRANKVRVRQGEWFFVSVRDVRVDPGLILKHEPLVRGRGSKPHMCEELYREGGETVYVNRRYPNGLTQAQFARLSEKVRSQPDWRRMVRNPRVLVRGKVRHSDHKTISLNGWHQVLMNTESQAAAMRNVAFLD